MSNDLRPCGHPLGSSAWCYACAEAEYEASPRQRLWSGTTHPQAPASPLLEAEAQKAVAPFGWYGESRFDNDFTTNEDTSRRWHANGYRLTPLYATPSAGAPLSLEKKR